MRQVCVLALALGIFIAMAHPASSDEPDGKTITIPLDQIWAFNMRSTRDVRELEPASLGRIDAANRSKDSEGDIKGTRVQQIRGVLRVLPADKEAAPGFAVEGSGLEALRGAHKVIVEQKPARHSFVGDREVSLVFFCHSTRSYCHLSDVERCGKQAVIRFRFVPHLEEEITCHFALIPLGKLQPGDYTVKIVQLPMGSEFERLHLPEVGTKDAQVIVCKSFSFSVTPE